MKNERNQKGRALVYTRFSPRPNAATCESCEVQRAYCEQYATQKGLEIVRYFDDPDRSGSDEFREVLWAAIDALKKGDVLLVYKRDRLARNVYLSEQINRCVAKKGATIVATTGDVEGDTPEAVMIRQVLASIGEYERKLIAMRTKAAMRHYMKEGRRMGGQIPYGVKLDPNDSTRIVANDKERAAIKQAVSMRKNGATLREIVAALPKEASRTGRWHYEQVRRIIARASEE